MKTNWGKTSVKWGLKRGHNERQSDMYQIVKHLSFKAFVMHTFNVQKKKKKNVAMSYI